MRGNFYETADIRRILCVGNTRACEIMKEWKSEITALGKYPGAKGLISKAYVDEKLYTGAKEVSKQCRSTSNAKSAVAT